MSSPSTPRPPPRDTLRALILPVYLPTLVLAFCDGLLIPVLPLLANEITPSLGLVGIVLGASAAGKLAMDLPAGALLGRLGRKGAMVLGIALLVLSTAGVVWVERVWTLAALQVVSGVGGALWNLSRHTYLAEVTRGGERGRAVSLFGGVNRIGTFLGPAVGGLLAATLGLRAPFVLFTVLAAATLPLVIRFTEAGTRASAGASRRVNPWPLLLARRDLFLRAGLGQLLAQGVRAGRRILIPLYGASVLGLGPDAIGFIISVAAAIDMSLFYPAGLLMDRRGRKWAIVPSFALQGLGMALVPLSGGGVGLALAASVIGLGNGLGAGTMMTLGADLAPEGALGEWLGAWRLAGDGGSMAGPLLVGAVAQVLSLPLAALTIAGVGAGAALVFAFGVPETLRRDNR